MICTAGIDCVIISAACQFSVTNRKTGSRGFHTVYVLNPFACKSTPLMGTCTSFLIKFSDRTRIFVSFQYTI